MDSDLVFDWDAANRDHIARHQVSPEEAEQIIDNDPLDIDAETINGEERITSVGRTNGGRILLVVTTIRESKLRVVTAFPAPKHLAEIYFRYKGA